MNAAPRRPDPQRKVNGALLILTAAIIAAVITLMAMGTVGAEGPSDREACSYAQVQNTVRMQATPQAIVHAGAELNGTGGSVIFEEIPLSHPSGDGFEDVESVRLVGPDGVERGPWWFGLDVLFPRVPLCHTGTWKLVDNDTGDVLSRFRTTEDAGVRGPGTVLLDQPRPEMAEWSFDAGSIQDTWPDDSHDNTIQRPLRADLVVTEVTVDWDTNLTEFSTSRVFAVLEVEGENGSVLTTRELPLQGEGSLEAYARWRSPGSYFVAIATWEVEEYPDHWSGRNYQASQLFVTPERGPDPPPVSAALPGGASAGVASS